MRWLSFRYSLRALFALVTMAGLAIGWLALPTLKARQFVAAMEQKDYAAAEGLFPRPGEPFPGDWKQHEVFQPRTILKPLTLGQLLRRERHLIVGVAYGDEDGGLASCTVEIKATANGLETGMALP